MQSQVDVELPFEHPDDAWLSGYFLDYHNDERGEQKITGVRKNEDFLRLKDFALHLLQPRPGMRVLDVGCSTGATMVYCGLQGAEVAGQDLDPEAVTRASALLGRYGLRGEIVAGDARSLGFPDRSFDAVVANDFFEHIDEPTKVEVLREIRRVLKPGAPAVLRTPNLNYLKLALRFKQIRGLGRFQNPRKFVIPHTPGTDDPQHIGLSTRKSLTKALVAAGFVNYQYEYAPLRRFGPGYGWEVLSTEIPILRDHLSEDLVCVAYCPITLSHFPD